MFVGLVAELPLFGVAQEQHGEERSVGKELRSMISSRGMAEIVQTPHRSPMLGCRMRS